MTNQNAPLAILLLLALLPLPLLQSQTNTGPAPGNLYRQGLAALTSEDYPSAADAFLNALKIRADHPPTYYHLGLTYKLLGQFDNALFTFNRVLEFKKIDTELRTGTYIEMMRTSLLASKPKRAVQYGLTALRVVPPSTPLLQELGRAYLRTGDNRRARRAAELALSLEPENPDSYHLLGISLTAAGLLSSALTAFETASAFQPDNPVFHAAAGENEEKQSNPEMALKHYRRAAALKPDPEYRNAIRRLERALSESP